MSSPSKISRAPVAVKRGEGEQSTIQSDGECAQRCAPQTVLSGAKILRASARLSDHPREREALVVSRTYGHQLPTFLHGHWTPFRRDKPSVREPSAWLPVTNRNFGEENEEQKDGSLRLGQFSFCFAVREKTFLTQICHNGLVIGACSQKRKPQLAPAPPSLAELLDADGDLQRAGKVYLFQK